MAFSCHFYCMRVFWNTEVRSSRTDKPLLCYASRNDGDNNNNSGGDRNFDLIHICSVQRMICRQIREEELARLNFIASVRPETARAILDDSSVD